jgi:hypothetical protein
LATPGADRPGTFSTVTSGEVCLDAMIEYLVIDAMVERANLVAGLVDAIQAR